MKDQETRVPTISVGFLVVPVVTSNFHTGDGGNTVANAVMTMAAQVIGSTTEKLAVAIKAYCHKLGVEVEDLDDETVKTLVVQTLTSNAESDINGVVSGVIDEHGKTIIDNDALKTVTSGGRTDN